MSNGGAGQQSKEKPSEPWLGCRQVQNTTCFFPAGKLRLEKTGNPHAPAFHASEIFKVNRCFSLRFGFAPSHKPPLCLHKQSCTKAAPAPEGERIISIWEEKGSSCSCFLFFLLFFFYVYAAAVFKFAAAL